MSSKKSVFINLPSKDLEASKRFAAGLGLTKKFDGCEGMQTVSFAFAFADNIQLFYHGHNTWKQWLFEGRETADAHKVTQALVTFSAESPEEVERMIEGAVKAGGKRGPNMMPDEEKYGMYTRSVEDPDGHVFEIVYSSNPDCGL